MQSVVEYSDIYFSYKKLLNDTINAGKILRHERSSSAVIFYWGINQQFPQLQLHNILFSKNYQEEFNHIFTLKKTYHDPSIYINISSKEENAMAPAGKENWFVMVNVPANTGQDWDLLKQNLRQNVIEKINRMLNINLEELIESEQVLDPVLMEEQTGSFMGSLYGSSSNSKLAAFLRHSNFTDSIKGLYFCGGSVHPGGGIPLCLHSAKIVSNLITADLKKQSH